MRLRWSLSRKSPAMLERGCGGWGPGRRNRVDRQVKAVVEADALDPLEGAAGVDRGVRGQGEDRHGVAASCEEALARLVGREFP